MPAGHQLCHITIVTHSASIRGAPGKRLMMHAVATASLGVRSDAAVRLRSGGLRGLQGVGGSGLRVRVRNPNVGVRCEVITVHEGNFEQEVLKSDVPVLVDFWASWCGPCKLVAKSMDAVDRKYAGKLKVVKVETDPNPTLMQMFQVYGLPTLIMFRDGEVVEGGRHEGAISLKKLESMLEEVLPSLATA